MLISSIQQNDSVIYVFFFMFFSVTCCHSILNIVPGLLTFLVLLWSLPFDFPFFSLSIYICYTSSCHNKEIDGGVTQTCVQIQALPFFPVLLLSHVRLFVAPWTVASQAPLFVGFPRQEYWSGLPLLLWENCLPFHSCATFQGWSWKVSVIYFLLFIVFMSPEET